MINFKNKSELTFFVIGILMSVIVLVLIISSIRFLTKELNRGLGAEEINQGATIQFNIEKIESLKK